MDLNYSRMGTSGDSWYVVQNRIPFNFVAMATFHLAS